VSDKVPRPGIQHPQPWRDDLNPDRLAGQNYGTLGPQPEKSAPTAYDYKGVHRRLQDIPDDVLKKIPVMPEGSRLEQGPRTSTSRTNIRTSSRRWGGWSPVPTTDT
jgi:hypothetical protein